VPTPSQQSDVSAAIVSIRSAQNLLRQQVNAATDTTTAIKLTNEYQNLDSNVQQLLHAQNAADDAVFSAAVSTLKSETSGLQTDETAIKGIISDVDTATKVVGYIGQALSFIAKL
jgi:hypothetical protein